MTGNHDNLSKLVEKKITQRVELWDNGKYEVSGMSTLSFQLELGGNLPTNNNLYVPGLKKNLLSISSLEDKGYIIAFVDGNVLIWKKGASFEYTKVIGVWIGVLYHLLGNLIQALLHNITNICELWHRRYTHIHCKTLSRMKYFVKGVP